MVLEKVLNGIIKILKWECNSLKQIENKGKKLTRIEIFQKHHVEYKEFILGNLNYVQKWLF